MEWIQNNYVKDFIQTDELNIRQTQEDTLVHAAHLKYCPCFSKNYWYLD